MAMLTRRGFLLLWTVCNTFLTPEAANKEKDSSAVYDEMFSLLDEKANLESEITRLQAEVSRKRQQLQGGQYQLDTEACQKIVKCEPMSSRETVDEKSPLSGQSVRNTRRSTLFDDSPDLRSHDEARFIGKYPFPTKPIPVMEASDPNLKKMLQEGRPVVIKNSGLAKSAQLNWNMMSAVENVGGANLSITVSSTRQFLYFKEELNQGGFAWRAPYRVHKGVFADFIDMVEELDKVKNGTYTYFHCPLDAMEQGVGMKQDYKNFNWNWLDKTKPSHWGKLRVNLLLVGMPNVVTPAHYDSMQNLFAQLRGFKRCLLFEPGAFKNLYVYPTTHPSDRQTQVDFDQPNFAAFPKLRELSGYEAVVGPGDILYIPVYWFHYIESEMDRMTMSLNFWFDIMKEDGFDDEKDDQLKERPQKGQKTSKDSSKVEEDDEREKEKGRSSYSHSDKLPAEELPKDTHLIKQIEELELSRHIESLVAELRGPRKVGSFLHDFFDKRFDYLHMKPDQTMKDDADEEDGDDGGSENFFENDSDDI